VNFHFDHKKLAYFFYGTGLLLIMSLLMAISGNQSAFSSVGSFLFSSFSFPSFYLPFFLIVYGFLTYKEQLYNERILILTLTVIPFLTLSLVFRLLFSSEESRATLFLLNALGKNRALMALILIAGFEVFLLYFIPRYFVSFDGEEDPEEDYVPEREAVENEEDAFKEYAFRFPEPEDVDFTNNNSAGDSIDDIFTSILSGGSGEGEPVPPVRPTVVEPVKEENPYESLQSPLMDRDPAIAVLAGDDIGKIDDDLKGTGDYTYHKYEDREPQVRKADTSGKDRDPQIRKSDIADKDRNPQPEIVNEIQEEAEVKINEIIAELDSVLSAADDTDSWPEPEPRDSQLQTESKNNSGGDIAEIHNVTEDVSGDDEQVLTSSEDSENNVPDSEEPEGTEYSEEAGYISDRLDELDEFRDISSKLAPLEGDEGGVLREVQPKQSKYRDNYAVPVEGVLAEYPDDKYSEIDEDTRKAARVLEITLEEFKISAKVTGIKKGPVITMFELLPAPGVKISKITNLADNIALRLAASRVRIVAPIPGKHAVGIEVPNKKRAIVSFSEMVSAPEMKDQDIAVPIVLGKDIRGGTQVIDLTRTPHLLIAGATGSGKSVCVNSLICSILYERSPADVKMILVDPKIVELKLYNDIPHLLTPVITDPKKAIQAIQWCLYEMERRYSLLDALGVREIRSYNKRVKERNLATTELPYLILVIDEFADLMATSGKELEAMIARLAAMSRAVGIHLVLATQRPSADVITGLIKANFPSRVAFMVASMMDSRIIIDSSGAEKLLGKGDMLFTSAWDPFPSRVQGAFMSEEEVERVVAYVKTLGAPEYIDDEIFIDDDEADEPSHSGGSSSDPLFNKALEIVGSAGKASASYLQRRLKIGYNRAARLVEQMEEMGIVGPQNGSKPREVIHMPESSNYQ